MVVRVRLVSLGLPDWSPLVREIMREHQPSVWIVSGDVRAVMFKDTTSDRYAILHRSTKPNRDRYPWQLSRFDKDGPFGDTPRPTPSDAVTDGLDGCGGHWVVAAVHPVS